MQNRENDYKSDLLAELKDTDYAAEYVSAAAAESWDTFLLALRDVVDAQIGMAKLASEAGVDRVNLYRMLSGKGNPRFKNLFRVFEALHLRIAAVPDSEEICQPEKPPTIPAVEARTHSGSGAGKAIKGLIKAGNGGIGIIPLVDLFGAEPQCGSSCLNFDTQSGSGPLTINFSGRSGTGEKYRCTIQDQGEVGVLPKGPLASVQTYPQRFPISEILGR